MATGSTWRAPGRPATIFSLVVVPLVLAACCVSPATAALDANEFRSIDFDNLLAGPLLAVVQAQAMSFRTTMSYIRDIGFNTDPATGDLKAITMDFKFKGVGDDAQPRTRTVKIPVLCMIPIPYMTIDTFSFDFRAKISSSFSTEAKFDMSMSIAMSYGNGARRMADSPAIPGMPSTPSMPSIPGFGGGSSSAPFGDAAGGMMSQPTNFLASMTSMLPTPPPMPFSVKASVNVGISASFAYKGSESYSMGVQVQARQAPMPEGVMKILDRLRQATRRNIKAKHGGS